MDDSTKGGLTRFGKFYHDSLRALRIHTLEIRYEIFLKVQETKAY